MKDYLLLLLICSSLIGFSQDKFRKLTRNGSSSFKKGDYVTASVKSSQALLQNPKFKKAIKLYENAIQIVYKSNEIKINDLKEQALPYKDFKSVEKMEKIIKLYSELQKVRDASSLIGKVKFNIIKNPMDFGRNYKADIQESKTYLEEYKLLAAEEFYVLGTTQFAQAKTKEQFFEASKSFGQIKKFASNYKDALALENETLGIYNEMSAEELYNNGLEIFNNAANKRDYQRAYYVLIQIGDFIANYKDSDELIRIAVDRGTYRLVFMPTYNLQAFSRVLRELYSAAMSHAQSLAFVEVIDVKAPNVSNIEALARYVKTNYAGQKIDHLYKINISDFRSFFVDKRVLSTENKVKKIKKKDVETNIAGSFSKLKTSSRAISNGFLEVININTFESIALINLSQDVLKSRNYWIFNGGDIKAFVKRKHIDPLVSDERNFIQNVTNDCRNSVIDLMKANIAQQQQILYK